MGFDDIDRKFRKAPTVEEEEYDDYGNIIGGDLIYCVFPNCGCDGARLCMAKEGASWCASGFNIEKGSR